MQIVKWSPYGYRVKLIPYSPSDGTIAFVWQREDNGCASPHNVTDLDVWEWMNQSENIDMLGKWEIVFQSGRRTWAVLLPKITLTPSGFFKKWGRRYKFEVDFIDDKGTVIEDNFCLWIYEEGKWVEDQHNKSSFIWFLNHHVDGKRYIRKLLRRRDQNESA